MVISSPQAYIFLEPQSYLNLLLFSLRYHRTFCFNVVCNVSEYKENIVSSERACPSNFTRISMDSCAAFYSKPVGWLEAYSLCKTYTAGIGYLLRYNPLHRKTNITLSFMNVLISAERQSFWLGYCNGEFYTYTTSGIVKDHFALCSHFILLMASDKLCK